MALWQFVGGPANGGYSLSLTAAKQRRLTLRLSSPSEASFSIDGRHPLAAALVELQTDLHVLYTPTGSQLTRIVYRGRMGAMTDTLDADTHTLSVTSMDYRELLKRRLLYNSSILTYTGLDQSEIAWQLIQQTQTRPGGNLSISQGIGNPSGITQTRTFEAGDNITDSINQLGQTTTGFEWDLTPISASALSLDRWLGGQRGTNRGVVLVYGGLVQAVRRETNPADYANAIRLTGDQTGGAPPTPQERAAPDIATRPEGRWDKAMTAPGVVDLAALTARADWQIADVQVFTPAYTLTLRRGAWAGPEHIWLGDTVLVAVKSGRLAVGGVSYRVQEMSFDIPEDGGQEQLTVTVGRPPSNYNRWPALVDQRLRDLERR